MKKLIAKLFLKRLLKLDNWLYSVISRLAIIDNNGKHPKHNIIQYPKWFSAHIKKDSVVCDLGCGDGVVSKHIAKKAQFICAIDNNEKTLLKALDENDHENILYIQDDIVDFDYSIDKFGCIILSNVLEHLKQDKRKKLLDKLPKSRILIRVPQLTRSWLTIYKKTKCVPYYLDRDHHIEYTIDVLRKELQTSDINIIEHEIMYGEIYAVCEKN